MNPRGRPALFGYMGRLAIAAVALALAACSPGYRTGAPVAPPRPARLLAEEDALRAMVTWPRSELHGTLDRRSVRAGEGYGLTGTSDCGALEATLDLAGDADPPATVRTSEDGAFAVHGVVPRGTAPQTAQVVVVTTCGPAESGAVLALPLDVTA